MGVDESMKDNAILIYPTPSYGKINIEMKHEIDVKNSILSIYTIQGKLILQEFPIKNISEIDLTEFAKGVYILKLNTFDNTFFSKIIKE